MVDEISFESGDKKETPKIPDASMNELRSESIRKLEKAQIDKRVRAEAGILEIPKEPESIPKELPKLAFKMGAKVISCDKFNLDDDESKIMAKHLSIIFGSINSKIYSVIIIVIITISKISECINAIKKIMPGKKKEEIEQMKEQGRPVEPEIKGKIYGDGTI